MIGKVIEGRYVGAGVYKLPDKNAFYIQTEDELKIAISKKNAISVENITDQYPGYAAKVMMVMWNDYETSVFQIGTTAAKTSKANRAVPVDVQPAEPQPVVVQPAEPQPVVVQPAEPQPVVVQPAEPQPVVVQPTEPQPVDVQLGEPQFGEDEKNEKGKKKSSKTIIGIACAMCLLAGVVIFFVTRHRHTWQPATCTSAKVCSECGETEGEMLPHVWDDATCIKPKTCADCGETEGVALGHMWIDATCTDAQTCSVCGSIEGDALGHAEGEWIDNPDNPKEQMRLCTRCSITIDTREYQVMSADGKSWSLGDIPDKIYNDSGFLVECNDFMGVYAKALMLMPDRGEYQTQLNFMYDSYDDIKVMRDQTTHSFVSLSFAGNEKLGEVPMKCVSLFLQADKLVSNYTSYKSVLLNILGALPKAIDSSLGSIEEGAEIIVELINAAADDDISKGTVKLVKDRAAVKKNGVTYTLFKKGNYLYITASIGEMKSLPPTVEEAYKATCTKYTYKQIARDPEAYDGKHAVFTGEVLQVQKDTMLGMPFYVMRVAITKDGRYYKDPVYVTYLPTSDTTRILEDDIITMYGSLTGEKTYTTILGASVTIPSFSAKYIDIK